MNGTPGKAALLTWAALGLMLVFLVIHDQSSTEELVDERKRRLQAERDADKSARDLDGALATIHDLKKPNDDSPASE